jgi:hypothetical protein
MSEDTIDNSPESQQERAWKKVCKTLDKIDPTWASSGGTGVERAVKFIEELAEGRKTDTTFQDRDKVRKVGGSYQCDGTVVAPFKTLGGEERYVFEFKNPAGMLHIFGPSNLVLRDAEEGEATNPPPKAEKQPGDPLPVSYAILEKTVRTLTQQVTSTGKVLDKQNDILAQIAKQVGFPVAEKFTVLPKFLKDRDAKLHDLVLRFLVGTVQPALQLAMDICDMVPNRAHEGPPKEALTELGKLVNAQGNGFHGYRVIRDALNAVKDYTGSVTLSEPSPGIVGGLSAREAIAKHFREKGQEDSSRPQNNAPALHVGESDKITQNISEEDLNYLCSTMDAEVWAEAFCKINRASDKDMMRAWFANAIMAGHDEASRKGKKDLLDWAVERWGREVKNRPLMNVNRRPLDDVWRQVVRKAGGDPAALLGPSHDDLLKEGEDRIYGDPKPDPAT